MGTCPVTVGTLSVDSLISAFQAGLRPGILVFDLPTVIREHTRLHEHTRLGLLRGMPIGEERHAETQGSQSF